MHSDSLLFYPEDILRKLDFETIFNRLLGHCNGSLGREKLENQGFSVDAEWIREELSRVNEFSQIITTDNQFPEQGFDQLPFLPRLGIAHASLSEHEFVMITKFLGAFSEILQFFGNKKRDTTYLKLYQLIQDTYWDKKLMSEIDRVIDRDREMVKESASPELAKIRKQILHKQHEQQEVFRKIIQSLRQKGVLAEQEEGVRGGRRVLAVKAEYKRQVSGIYHDESSNGSISFIEPDVTVGLNNECIELQMEEQREIARILRVLTEYIRPYLHHFKHYLYLLGVMDAIRAKARLAVDLDAQVPQVNNEGLVNLLSFRHPVLYLQSKKSRKKVVPNSLVLEPEQRMLMISGPNAGGKSVVLKSAGLLQLMFQMGMMLPLDSASSMCVFKKIFIDIGDAQSVENDLSTYSSHLKSMKYFTEHSNASTLILLDEMGDGTDPALGGAIAEAVLDTLLQRKAYAVITSHFANLKAWGSRTEGVENAAMAFDHKNLEPLYQMNMGTPGSSFTFEIAAKSGLSPAIVKSAKEKMGEEKKELELSLTEIQHEKQFIKGLRKNIQVKEKQLEELHTHYERLKKELDKEKKRLVKDYQAKSLEVFNAANRELEKMMREFKESNHEKEKFLETRKFIDDKRLAIEKGLDEPELVQPGSNKSTETEIVVGSRVRLEDGYEIGVVQEIRKNQALVAFGPLMTHVKIKQLLLVEEPKKPALKPKAVGTGKTLEDRTAFDINLDMRGLLKEEALTALEHFLDRAVMYNVSEVRIIHGRGTGVLKQMAHAYLKKYPYAKTYKPAIREAGGDGVTVVSLQ